MSALIFDWDNTLVDTIPVIKHSLLDTLNEFNYDGEKDKIISSVGFNNSMREGFPALFGDDWEKASEYFYHRYDKNKDLINKMAGFDEIIDYLKNIDIPIAINSNKRQDLLESEINRFEINNIFDIVVGSGICENDKPAPDGVNKICNHWKVNPNPDIYYIGDSEVDYKTAKNSGVSNILVSDKNDINTVTCKNLTELVNYLKNI